MSIRYLTVPVGDGEIKIAVEPFEPAQGGSGLEELGINMPQPASDDGFEDLGATQVIQNAVGQTTAAAEKAFERVSETIYTLAEGFKKVMEKACPDEASLEFSLAVKADAGVVLVQSGVESALKVNLTWKRKDSDR